MESESEIAGKAVQADRSGAPESSALGRVPAALSRAAAIGNRAMVWDAVAQPPPDQSRAMTVSPRAVLALQRAAGNRNTRDYLQRIPRSSTSLMRAPASPDASSQSVPQRAGIEERLRIVDETGATVHARLDEIIRTGGPMPDTKDGAKVIGAAIIDVEGYQGPKEMRSINGADTDALGAGAPVYHARSPTTRALSATQGAPTAKGGRRASILGPRNESINSHINDAEMKLFEDIISRLPKGAKGTISFTTMRVPKGSAAPTPYPACSGCIRASFETAGIPGVELVSHAPVHPPLATGHLGDADVGPVEPAKPPAKAADAPVKPPAAEDPAAPKPGTVAEVESHGTVGAGAAKPGPKVPGSTPRVGRAPEVAIYIGTGIASIGLAWLAAYLKARVDQKVAQQQIDAFLNVTRKRINANPDEAVKKMMIAPEVTVYAWVYLDSSVITTFTVDSLSLEPVMTDSSPMMDLSHIEYQFSPVDPSLVDSFPTFSGGGSHITTTRSIVIDVPLQTPSVEDMLAYAKARNLPLDGLLDYTLYRFNRSISTYEIALIDKRGEQKAHDEMAYWEKMVDLIRQAMPRP